ncbi:hypothetical protein J6590_047311 [Homalodisca vitripennis]|nr:hypothetical protein J6590_047311 [Homalodisca vitripennis]
MDFELFQKGMGPARTGVPCPSFFSFVEDGPDLPYIMFIEAFIPIQVQGLVPEPQPGHKPATGQWVLPSRPAFRLPLPYDSIGTSNPSFRPLPSLAATLTKYSGLGEFSRISELKAPCPTPPTLTEPNGGPPGRPCPQSPAHHVHLDPCFTHAG